MTPLDEGQEHPILDCGEHFEDVKELGYAVCFFTYTEYIDIMDHLAWLEEKFSGSMPDTEDGKKRKAQFEEMDRLIRKRWRRSAETFV